MTLHEILETSRCIKGVLFSIVEFNDKPIFTDILRMNNNKQIPQFKQEPSDLEDSEENDSCQDNRVQFVSEITYSDANAIGNGNDDELRKATPQNHGKHFRECI
jgi:hypothetical protein